MEELISRGAEILDETYGLTTHTPSPPEAIESSEVAQPSVERSPRQLNERDVRILNEQEPEWRYRNKPSWPDRSMIAEVERLALEALGTPEPV